jgi:hypothetical protein
VARHALEDLRSLPAHDWLQQTSRKENMENFLGMDAFTSAYYEAALWSSNDDDGVPLDSAKYSDAELAEETIARFKADCAKFQTDNAALLEQASEHQSTGHQGHDFWLTRNGHGAGFWDGDYPKELGDALTEASEKFGECDL